MDQAVAIGEAGQLAVGVVRGTGGVATGLLRLAQSIGVEADAQAAGIGQRGDMTQAGVAVADAEGFGAQGEGFSGGQAALVVGVGPGATVGGAGGVQRAIGEIAVTLAGRACRMGDGGQAVAGIVAARAAGVGDGFAEDIAGDDPPPV